MNLFRSAKTAPIGVNSSEERINSSQELADLVLRCHQKPLAGRSVLHPIQESVLIRISDFWVICYQGHATILKATRGLEYLAYLLCRQGREVHVTELLMKSVNHTTVALRSSSRAANSYALTAKLHDALPILDSRAKLEYKRRIDELRKDMTEAERFNDYYRTARTQSEIDAITEQLVAAVGLGGRDRRTSSDAERARSAVTRRIKETINRIAKALPDLGRHLAARIKTGYWCSYTPHPGRAIAWNLQRLIIDQVFVCEKRRRRA